MKYSQNFHHNSINGLYKSIIFNVDFREKISLQNSTDLKHPIFSLDLTLWLLLFLAMNYFSYLEVCNIRMLHFTNILCFYITQWVVKIYYLTIQYFEKHNYTNNSKQYNLGRICSHANNFWWFASLPTCVGIFANTKEFVQSCSVRLINHNERIGSYACVRSNLNAP